MRTVALLAAAVVAQAPCPVQAPPKATGACAVDELADGAACVAACEAGSPQTRPFLTRRRDDSTNAFKML